MRRRVPIAAVVAAALVLTVGCHSPPVPNLPPEVAVPSGPAAGRSDTVYTFTTSATDPEGELVSCRLFWGDGDSTDWSDFAAGGTEVAFQHTWTRGDTFEVTAQARDETGVRSSRSDPAAIDIAGPPAFPSVVLDTIDIPTDVLAAAASPDGRYAYFAGFGDISVVDVAARSCVDTIGHPLGDGITDMCMSPDGKYLYVRAYDGDVVMAISTETGQVVRSCELDLSSELVEGIGVHPDGQHVYVVEDYHTMAVIRTSDFTLEARVIGLDEPFGLAVTPDGSYVCVACYGHDELTVLRTSDNGLHARIPVGRHPVDAVATPDGRRVYVCCQDAMYVVRPDDPGVDTAFQIPPYPVRMAIQSSGDHIYVVHETGIVSVVRTADNRVDLLGSFPVEYADIACVPGDEYACIGVDSRRGPVFLLGTGE